jgi:PAS domain S-box-containing protein
MLTEHMSGTLKPMRAVIVGGGRGCRAIIELTLGPLLTELPLEILKLADPDRHAPGMVFARQRGIMTTTDMHDALSTSGIDLVIELTGNDSVLKTIYQTVPRDIRVFDHTFAKVLVDLANAQRKQAQQLQEITQLQLDIERERLFLASIFDTMPELVAVLDKNGKLTRVNAEFSQFTSRAPKDAAGRTCTDLLARTELGPSSDQTTRVLDSVLESHHAQTFLWQSPAPNNTLWEITLTPIASMDGATEVILSTWHRITEQAVLQHKIRAAEDRFQSFMDSAHDWISIKDLEGRYVVVNKTAAESLHLTPEDFIGKTPAQILPPDLATTIQAHDQEVLEDDRYRSFSEIVTIDGRDQHFQTNRFPLKDYKGSTIGLCTIMRNVTSEQTLRNQLEQAGRLAAIGKLAAGVAHEINNPLTGILAYAEDLLDKAPQKSQQYDDLFVIIQETLRCRDIVKNLLDFSRQENPKFESIDPNAVALQSINLVQKIPHFRNITIRRHLCYNTPNIQGDPHQIEQVILNLMMNAAEAMSGKGTISIITRHDPRHGNVIITVEDDGPGIPENLKDKIFEPFFSTKGTNGLGLAVSWGIIEHHLGKIEIEMSASGGASFSLVFPILTERFSFDEEAT